MVTTNSAIEINDNSIDTLRVKYRGHDPNLCSRKAFVRQHIGVLVCAATNQYTNILPDKCLSCVCVCVCVCV